MLASDLFLKYSYNVVIFSVCSYEIYLIKKCVFGMIMKIEKRL